MKVKVVGLGNVTYGDDGVGSCIAQFLSQANDFVLDGNAHGMALLGDLSEYDVLIFIDVDADLKPGQVALERLEGQLDLTSALTIDAHRLGPSEAIGYLRAMGKGVEGWLIGIGPKSLEPFSGPSEEVKKAVPVAINLLREVLEKYGLNLKLEGDPTRAVEECYRRALGNA
jgi:hydrogenase maturation protease